MTQEEKDTYVKERKMREDKINEFADRILINDELKRKLMDVRISQTKQGNVDTFRNDLLKEFNKILYYHELTMKVEGYKAKYLKYKNKYLQLKNHKN
jgi:hypothetical protein